MTYVITVRTWERQPAAVVRFTCTPEEIPARIGDAFAKIGQYLHEAGIEQEITGVFTRYLSMGEKFDAEAGFIIRSRVEGSGDVRPGELPEGDAAVTLHVGPYPEVGAAYQAIQEWMSAHGRAPAGGPWEVYLNEPGNTPEQELRTELYQPLMPAS